MLRGILYFLISSLFLFTACRLETGANRFQTPVDGSGKMIAGFFNQVELDGNFIVYIQNGDSEHVVLNGDQQRLNMIIVDMDNQVLKITDLEQEVRSSRRRSPIVINITAREISRITGRHAIKMITSDVFRFDTLTLNFSGAADLNLNLDGNYLKGLFEGASSVKAQGVVNSFLVEMPGAGKLLAYDLIAQKVDLNLAGAGKAQVYASQELRVNIAGACSVTYKGSPENLFSNISGIGRVKQVEP
ncbi:head GIN domain-containing protein [Alkaliflexus imshenetskii]|uniref:head GIN domain-containing protein n=1 Tax=Alkaliflexus imshenetskii TaxID=286730 RepID=UPI00047CAEDC|nr:head GIN domain-containing protein [Alkaliflexus imshenetskii]